MLSTTYILAFEITLSTVVVETVWTKSPGENYPTVTTFPWPKPIDTTSVSIQQIAAYSSPTSSFSADLIDSDTEMFSTYDTLYFFSRGEEDLMLSASSTLPLNFFTFSVLLLVLSLI